MYHSGALIWAGAIALSLTLHLLLLIHPGPASSPAAPDSDSGVAIAITLDTSWQPPSAEPPVEVAQVRTTQRVTPATPPSAIERLPNRVSFEHPSRQQPPNPDPAKAYPESESSQPPAVSAAEPPLRQTEDGVAPTRAPLRPIEAAPSYMSRLLAHIERHRFYPMMARRRGISGDVVVSFSLSGDGSIERLKLLGGHHQLERAAREAMERALPLPPPPVDVTLPAAIRLTISYRLE